MDTQPKERGIRRIAVDWWLVLITLLAAVPRLYRPGLFNLWWDEVLLLRRSLRLVMLHEYSFEANRTTWTAIPIHSPITTVTYAIPYTLSHDPRAVRFFQALLAVFAVVVVYLMMRRFYGHLAAILTGVLTALSPQLIEWSRWVLNPNMAQLFIALWLLTGLVGYLEGKRGRKFSIG